MKWVRLTRTKRAFSFYRDVVLLRPDDSTTDIRAGQALAISARGCPGYLQAPYYSGPEADNTRVAESESHLHSLPLARTEVSAEKHR